tara:strand:+ start:111 stop:326 length:216 start_codon:yes stop_codon:yes gene_type:complete
VCDLEDSQNFAMKKGGRVSKRDGGERWGASARERERRCMGSRNKRKRKKEVEEQMMTYSGHHHRTLHRERT